MRQLFAGIDQGAFREVKPRGGTGDFLVHAGRGTAFGDPDNDGDVDIVMPKKDPPASVLHNTAPKKGGSRQFRLVNRQGADAVGATFTAVMANARWYKELYPSYGYCSSNDPRIHIGLAKGDGIEMVIVRWPCGAVEVFQVPDSVFVQVIREGEGRPFSP